MKYFAGAAAMSLMTAFLVSASARDLDYTSDPLDQIKSKVESKKVVLLDVRERREWDRGHLRDAVFLPLSRISAWDKKGMTDAEKEALAKTLPKGTVVYCHCAAGGRSLPAAEALKKFGYDARPLKPGYDDLLDAGFKPVTPK